MQDCTNIDDFNEPCQQAYDIEMRISEEDDPKELEDDENPNEEFNDLQFEEMENQNIYDHNEDSMQCNFFIDLFAQEDLLEDENYHEEDDM